MKVQAFIPRNQFRYYYSTLNIFEKKAYDTMVNHLLAFDSSFRVFGIDFKRLGTLFHYIKYDIPELFYVKSVRSYHYASNPKLQYVSADYRFNNTKVCEMLQEMENRYHSLITSKQNASDIEKEQSVHDIIVASVKYKDTDKPYSHEAPGTLLYDIGVCEGISKAAKWLCDRLDLQCVVAIGKVNKDGNLEDHAWNMIWVDGVPYHVDITYDKGISRGGLRYDYFNLGDNEMMSNRFPDTEFPLPKTKASRNWYKEHGLFFRSKSEMLHNMSIILSQKIISFQLPMFEDRREETANAVNAIVSKHFNQVAMKGRTYLLHYNLDRMVFELVFSEVM